MRRVFLLAGVAFAAYAAVAPASTPLTRVAGGTAAQRALLEDVLLKVPLAQLRAIEIRHAHPRSQFPAHAVALAVVPDASRRARWESQVVADAFQARSLLKGLQPVTQLGDTRLWGAKSWKPKVRAQPYSPRAQRSVERVIRHAAGSVGARVDATVAQPWGLVATIRLDVADAKRFLAGRALCRFERRARLARLRGYYLTVWDGRRAAIDLATRGLGLVTDGSWARSGIRSPCLVPLTLPGP